MRELALGMVIGMCAFALPLACTSGRLPEIVRCQLRALEVLPDDPHMATLGDLRDIIDRVHACQELHDAGLR